MYDATTTFDYMPSQWLTFRAEMGYRHSDIPYFSGRGGITPPNGNNAFLNTGAPSSYVCTNGTFSDVSTFAPSGQGFSVDNNQLPSNGGGSIDQACFTQNGGAASPNGPWYSWAPDLRKSQINATFAIMTRF
jgi:hypothetical protein